MTSFIHFPDTSDPLSLWLSRCNLPDKTPRFSQQFMASNRHIHRLDQRLQSHQAIMMPGSDQPHCDISMPNCSNQDLAELKEVNRLFGGVGTTVLAGLYDTITPPSLYGNLTTFASGAGAATTKIGDYLLQSINDYDQAAANVFKHEYHSATEATLDRLKQTRHQAFKKMHSALDRKSQALLHKNTFKTQFVRNHRGKTIVQPIPVSTLPEVHSIQRLSKAATKIGPGLIVLDGALRTKGVVQSYKSGDPGWKREAFVESSSFLFSVGAGATIGFVIMALVPGGFLLAAVAGGLLALGADAAAKKAAGKLYDLAVK